MGRKARRRCAIIEIGLQGQARRRNRRPLWAKILWSLGQRDKRPARSGARACSWTMPTDETLRETLKRLQGPALMRIRGLPAWCHGCPRCPCRALMLAGALLAAGCASRRPTQRAQITGAGGSSLTGRRSDPSTVFFRRLRAAAATPKRGQLTAVQLALGGTLAVASASLDHGARHAASPAGKDAAALPLDGGTAGRARPPARPLPLAALFDWLGGIPTPVAGWLTDLSQAWPEGRLLARQRSQPGPAVELRILLDR